MNCFLSYSWDSDDHKNWVLGLATKLQENGVYSRLDQWDVKPGTDLAHYMETSIRESSHVLLICTKKFCEKANAGAGGVGYEKSIVTGELFSLAPTQAKFVPLLCSGTSNTSLPSYLKSRAYIDFRSESDFDVAFEQLLRHLLDEPSIKRPPLGQKPKFNSTPDFDFFAGLTAKNIEREDKIATFCDDCREFFGVHWKYEINVEGVPIKIKGLCPQCKTKMTLATEGYGTSTNLQCNSCKYRSNPIPYPSEIFVEKIKEMITNEM